MALLEVLEVNRSPSSFAAWIERFEFAPAMSDSRRALEDFRVIQKFLVDIYGDHWNEVVRRTGGAVESAPRDSVHGKAEFGCFGSVFQVPDGESGGEDGRQFYFFISSLSEEERKELGELDEGYEVSINKPSKRGAQRSSSWKQNNRKMMANQLLPYDFDELNGSDLGRVWKGLWAWWKRHRFDTDRKVPRRQLPTLEIGALLWVMLWTVSSIERARTLQVAFGPDNESQGPLSLLINNENGKEIKNWRVAALPARARIEAPTQNSRPVVDHILLPDLCGGSAWVLKLWRQKRDRSSVLFGRSLEEYEARIGKLFDSVRQTKQIPNRLTANRYSKVLFWRLLRRSRHDFSAVSMVTGQDHRLNRSRLHYTTRRVADMQKLYVDCAQKLAGEIARACDLELNKTDLQSLDVGNYLGAPHCPTLATVSAAVANLRDRIREKGDLRFPNSQDERQAFAADHDDLTLYTYWMFAFASGIRGIVNPYPPIELVDIRTGIHSIEDKEANSGDLGYKRRLVWLPPVLREQMKAYHSYLNLLKRKCKVASQHPSFFLTVERDHLRPVKIRPAELESRVERLLPFPANTQRLFLRSELLERGCCAEVVDAFMGHWSFGEEPWAPYSTFNYAPYFAALEEYLAPLLQKIGFEVVHKRIVG